MHIICSDLEGVFVPEIWINVAKKTGIEELRLTTRDISDYNVLMKKRLAILDEHKLKLSDIQAVIKKIDPLEGAVEFLSWIRKNYQIIIVSDTFVEFASPLMEKLGRPTLLCHSLIVEPDGFISGYTLRQQDGKRKVVKALKSLSYQVLAFGDSYNDINMLKEADTSFLFRPPANVIDEFPEIQPTNDYSQLKEWIIDATA
ncbi:MAG: bifunctional phosphoserine phosphatase/homoserine phosphotransferase ThrH [Desulfobacteraceae bacterium]|nr:bifunctional phosphoserine phosphatase/homoserine phosphotransferase ThrH [Desulfobacteraceae bacterium]